MIQQALDYFSNNVLELVGTIFGLICVYLNTKANIWGWITGIVSITAYIFVFWDAHLYGDFILHLIYLAFSFYGLYHWLYGGGSVDALPISRSSRKELIVLSVLGTLGVPIAAELFIYFFEKPYQPYWDAVIFSFSLVAQWQLAQKRIENWLFWIGIDSIALGLYFSKGLLFTSFLYAVYLGLATWGYWRWKKILLQQQKVLVSS